MKNSELLTMVNTERLLTKVDSKKVQLLRVEVIFGASSDNCRGTGICKMVATPLMEDNAKTPCNRTGAFLRFQAPVLQLIVPKTNMCPHLKKRQFQGSLFEVSEDFLLPESLSAYLGLASGLIPAGSYPLTENGEFFATKFDFSKI